jgi:hypothetical protein
MAKFRIVLVWCAGLMLASAAPLIFPRNWGYKPTTGTVINWGSPLSQGLAGAYLLNSGAGGRAYDSTGINPPAVLNNSPAQAPADARLGKGLSLAAGSSQSADFGSGPKLVIGAGSFTFAVGYQSAATNALALSSRAAGGAGYEILVGASGAAGNRALKPAEVLELYVHPFSMFESPAPLTSLLSPNGSRTIHRVAQQ